MSLLPRCQRCGQMGFCNCPDPFPVINLPHRPISKDSTTFIDATPMWQLCPKCNGNIDVIKEAVEDMLNLPKQGCLVCDNTGLIHRFSGKPPKK